MGRSIREEIYCTHTHSIKFSFTNMLKSQHDKLCLAGTILSCYALYVKYAHKADNSFTPVIGSTAAFSSEFGKGLGGLVKGENFLGNISNSTLGIVYYIFMALISQGGFWENLVVSKLRLFLSIASGLPCLFYMIAVVFVSRCMESMRL